MWYNGALVNEKDSHYDDKIVKSMTIFEIRKRLFLDNDPYPYDDHVMALSDKVIKELQSRYGELHKIRRYATSDYISPLIQEVINDVMQHETGINDEAQKTWGAL